MTQSMSQLSTGQSSTKKMKNMTTTTTAMIHPMADMKDTHTHHQYVFKFI
jgi:hypothetical protein